MSYRLLFDPLKGAFNFVRIPIITTSGGGGIIYAGLSIVTSSCTIQFNGGLDVLNDGSIAVEPGGTLLVT